MNQKQDTSLIDKRQILKILNHTIGLVKITCGLIKQQLGQSKILWEKKTVYLKKLFRIQTEKKEEKMKENTKSFCSKKQKVQDKNNTKTDILEKEPEEK